MVGVDLVNIPDFAKNLDQAGEWLLERTFLASELGNRKIEHLAGIFAAKEAVIKALSMKAGSWLEIEITHSPVGQPCAKVGQKNINVSISHAGDYATAVAQTNYEQ